MSFKNLSFFACLVLVACGNSSKEDETSQRVVPAKRNVCQNYSINLLEPCSKISDQNFNGADLRNKNLQGSILKNVQFNNANLSGANLQDTDVRSVNFASANLQGADFSGSIMDETTNFASSDLRGTYFVRGNNAGKLEFSDLKKTRIDHAKMNVKTVALVDFESAVLENQIDFQFSTPVVGKMILLNSGTAVSLASEQSDNPISEFNRRFLTDVFEDFSANKFKADPKSLFYKFFGSLEGVTSTDKLKNYLGSRIKYFFHSKAKQKSAGAQTVAFNSTINWFNALLNSYITKGEIDANPVIPASFNLNGQRVIYSNSSVQVVGLGDLMFNGVFNSLSKLSAVIHEGRHSDCLEIPTATQLRAIMGMDRDPMVAKIALQKCHQAHVKCPKGHSLAGEFACDDYAWGAYTVSFLVDNYVAQNCETCSPREKLQALAREKDDRTRILVFDDILNGRAGEPNLKHVAYNP